MELIAIVKEAWGWTGLEPSQIVGDNDFGNLMVKDQNERYWRICPEDLYCKIVARSREELDRLSQDQEFLRDWHMSDLVQQARQSLGPLRPGFKYCLKIPGVLGGEYGGDNLATISLSGLISASGDIAQQIEDLPDGAQVKLSIVG
ncbi:T6SS immunity protein Tdi1 domain-containing protein [Hydrogenophaga pseudoflava]|uniref:T6SS immunity protein Tdi1 domain-containing protein n=1 Tax=Hydrogenophaga pseudoflava TaxID=47421 RepID=UPI0010572187|nr:T6SS immunity protein Tdi1 domain-containing protein [Hydrogenophaga pseudoflava]